MTRYSELDSPPLIHQVVCMMCHSWDREFVANPRTKRVMRMGLNQPSTPERRRPPPSALNTPSRGHDASFVGPTGLHDNQQQL